MKRILSFKIAFAIILMAGLLYGVHYYLTLYLYEQMWENPRQLQAQNDMVPTKLNYKDLTYNRVDLPSCASCGTLCFEELAFDNDSVLLVKHNSFSAESFNVYKKIFWGPDTSYTESFVFRGDTLLGNRQGNYQNFMVWSFKNDTFDLTCVSSKN